MSLCGYCDKEIKGKSFKRTMATCHPAVTYFEVEVCFKCKHFPSNTIESNETLIK